MSTEREQQTVSEPPRLRLDALLRELAALPEVTLGDLVDRAAESGVGLLIGVLAIVAIPFVGLSTPFAIATGLLGAQLAIGRARPWLPSRLRRRRLTPAMLDHTVAVVARRGAWLARITRPRAAWLVRPRLVGTAVLVLSIGLALPLPIPGSNLVFLVPMIVCAIGLVERDGAWIATGYALTLTALALFAALGGTIARIASHL